MTHQNHPTRWRRWAVATLLPLLALVAMTGQVAAAAPAPPAPPVPGAIGPVDPAILHAQGLFNRPVQQSGYTVYVNAHGETVTGAVPVDAVRGFTPAKVGRSYGPDNVAPNCYAGELPPQATHDHATFTAAELAMYHLPSASDLGIPFAEWATLMRATQHMSCTTRDTYDDGHPSTARLEKMEQAATPAQPQLPHTPARALDTCINYCLPEADVTTTPPGTNCPGTTVFICIDRHVEWDIGEAAWMGFGTDRYHCQSSSCPPLTEAVSYWHVPTAYSKGVTFDDSVAWVGLGGVITAANGCDGETTHPSLVQAGTESYHTGPALYDMWFENCSSSTPLPQTSSLTVNPGDLMMAYIGSSSSAHPASIFLQDQTRSETISEPDGPGSVWPAPDQNTAECVQEAKSNKQTYDAPPDNKWSGMTDFGTNGIHFEDCRAWTGYNTASIMGLGSMPGDTMLNFRYYMVDGTPAYCESTGWWDSLDPTYGYTSYRYFVNVSSG